MPKFAKVRIQHMKLMCVCVVPVLCICILFEIFSRCPPQIMILTVSIHWEVEEY